MSDRNLNFHLASTWQTRYKSTSCKQYQWIDNYKQIIEHLKQQFELLGENKQQCSILQLGCGTSKLNQELFNMGYSNIISVDFSKQVIRNRKNKKEQDKQNGVKYICADFTQQFDKFIKQQEQQEFNLIIQKNSLDCVFCRQDYLTVILKTLNQIYNRLKPNGKFISISLGIPKHRQYWYRNRLIPFQKIQVKKLINTKRQYLRKNFISKNIDKDNNHQDYYIYICTKRGSDEQNNMQGINIHENQQNNQNNQNNQGKQQNNQNNDYQNQDQDMENQQNQQQQNQKQQDNQNYQNQQQNNQEQLDNQQSQAKQNQQNQSQDNLKNNQNQQNQQNNEEDNYDNEQFS